MSPDYIWRLEFRSRLRLRPSVWTGRVTHPRTLRAHNLHAWFGASPIATTIVEISLCPLVSYINDQWSIKFIVQSISYSSQRRNGGCIFLYSIPLIVQSMLWLRQKNMCLPRCSRMLPPTSFSALSCIGWILGSRNGTENSAIRRLGLEILRTSIKLYFSITFDSCLLAKQIQFYIYQRSFISKNITLLLKKYKIIKNLLTVAIGGTSRGCQ